MAKKVLVTGGLGFIGSHTVVELIAQGHEVVILDNLSNTRIEVLDGIEKIAGVRPAFAKVDLRDKNALATFMQQHGKGMDGVIHFAAAKAVGESVEKPLYYYENNITALVYLLQQLTEKQNVKFVFSSSCTVYGEPDRLPITEDAPIKPAISPYGFTKQVGEQLMQDTMKANASFDAISLRYFNPIGAHDSALIGELPIGVPQNLIPFITQTAAGIREQLSIFGDDYPTSDGTAVRDYIHVVDLAKAHIAALDRMWNKTVDTRAYEVFNIGTGAGNSVKEVVDTFEKVAAPLKYKIAPRREGDIIEIYADTSKASNMLGWKAEKSLDECLSSAWKWQQSL